MFLDKKIIGSKLKEYRKKINISQEEISEKVNIAPQQYSRLERGLCMPTLLTFFKLIKILNIPLTEFGIDINAAESNNKNELIQEIFMLNEKEINACLTILKTIKKLK